MTQQLGKVVYSKMAAAMIAAVESCVAEGRNPRRIGRIVVTNKAAGVGTIWRPRLSVKNNNNTPAVSAVIKG